jgi:hypothetical protein
MKWMSARVVRVMVVLLAVFVTVEQAAAAPPPLPSHDAFYKYSGTKPLKDIPPGAILKRRAITVSFGTISTPVAAEQLLYRTTDQLGDPSVTVTTVIEPAAARIAPKIVGYLSFYDGLGEQCDPSYTIRGGQPDPATQQEAEEEELLVTFYLAHGFTVTIPDFEGEGLHWMAGRESGYGTLDALRATETYMHAPANTPVGLSGYSGGAVAADWASELAPAYAPKLNIVGVAEAAIPVDYKHMLAYINGTPVYSAAIPAILIGLARAYHLDLAPYLSAYGAKVVAAENNVCLDQVFGQYPGLTVQAMMKPRYRNFFDVPIFKRILGAQHMGMAATHPREPLLMGNGNADGFGDGVMSAADVRKLAQHYCHEGVPVMFQEYMGASHEAAGAFFEPQTGLFLLATLSGASFPSNCATLD